MGRPTSRRPRTRKVCTPTSSRCTPKHTAELSLRFALTQLVTLTFGEVGFRLSTSISLPRAKEKLEEIIRRLKSRQMHDCIVVEEKISKDALKKYGEDTVNAVGATWKQSDVFGYEVNIAKLEQIKAGG